MAASEIPRDDRAPEIEKLEIAVTAARRRTRVGSEPLYSKLRPRRKGGISPEQVAAHQRARLHGAMIEAVASRGFAATTVRQDLCARAGVSTRTFYEHFTDKRQCLLSTYRSTIRCAIRHMLIAQRDAGDSAARLRLSFESLARQIAADPKAARLALVDIFDAGPEALELSRRSRRMFEGLTATSIAPMPRGAPQSSPLVIKGIVAGIERVARESLLDGRAEELPTMAGEIVRWALSHPAPGVGELNGARPGRDVERPGTEPAASPRLVTPYGGPDRQRLLATCAKLSAAEGYRELTRERIAAAAGIPQHAFDRCFEDVDDCFLSAYELLCGEALEKAASAGSDCDDWPACVHHAVTALTDQIARAPALARVIFTEITAAGGAGIEARARLLADFAEALRRLAPEDERPSALAAQASVGAVWGVADHHVASGAARRLPAVDCLLTHMILAPALGPEASARAVIAEEAKLRKQIRTA